jgi:hypothetical protein
VLLGLLRFFHDDFFRRRSADALAREFFHGDDCAERFGSLLFRHDIPRFYNRPLITGPPHSISKYVIIQFSQEFVPPRAEFMEERDFFDEKQEKKPATLNCPHCHQSAEYDVTWIVRTKKRQLSGRADERDRARFAKFRSYMVRKDDMMACKNMRCRKRFELTGQSTVLTE